MISYRIAQPAGARSQTGVARSGPIIVDGYRSDRSLDLDWLVDIADNELEFDLFALAGELAG